MICLCLYWDYLGVVGLCGGVVSYALERESRSARFRASLFWILSIFDLSILCSSFPQGLIPRL